MNNPERLERLMELFDELSEMCIDRTIIVEGFKDRMAMTLAGINGEFICVQSEGGPLKVAEKLSEEKKEAIIMTDWDDEGKRIAKELERCLKSVCVKYDVSVRAKFRSLCGSEICDIESLPSFYCRLVTESERKKEGRNK